MKKRGNKAIMAKVHQKKVIAALLAASIAVPTPAFAASASDFTDFPKDWSAAALTHSVYNGLLSGSEGKIRASETLKRAEMAAIINRLAGAEKGASLDGYSDVPASAWYYQDMAKAVQLGTFVGDGSRLRPEEPMTRQEVLSVLARFYGLQGGSETALEKYADAENVAPWARNALAVMTECGYVHGAEGKIQPEKSITRAEFAQLLYNMAGNIANAGETISSDTAGNLIVRGTDTVLKNMTVHGDLILADGADKVVLENVEVKGRILVRGGSGEVIIRNSKAEKEIIVSNSHGTATILAEGSQLQNLKLRTDTNLQGSFANVEAEKPLRLTAEQGKIEQMTFQAGAERSVLLAKKEAEITSVHVAATGTEISGEGKIADITVKAKDVAVKTKGTKVTVSAGIEGTTADGKAVAADTVVVTEKTEEAKQKAEEKNGGEKKEESSGSTEDSGSSRKKKKKTE